ncbi:MAG: SpoIIIAH-like family protein [Clostridia bacterium]
MKNKKKIIVLSTMIVLLVASAFLNVWLNKKLTNAAVSGGNPPTVAATFSSFRSDRQTTRQEIIDYLDAILTASTSSTEAKTSAEKQKLDICTAMEQEMRVESLIKTKGFTDVIVTMSKNNCSVVVADDDLQSAEVAQIYSIVTSATEYNAKQIHISAY